MEKGRTVVWCALVFLAGDFVGGWLTLPPELYLVMASLAAVAALLVRRPAACVLALLLLGAASVQLGRMPPQRGQSRLKQRSMAVRDDISSFMDGMMPEGDELAVMKALTIGDKSSLDRELKGSYSRSGAMHLLALSGLHIGIIYKLLDVMLFFLGGSLRLRRLKSCLIVTALWTFALITGLSPSIARASLMITVYELSSFLHSRRDGLTALGISALIITLFDPEAPRQIGFQLSFCACLSIFVLYPRLSGMLSTRSRLLRYVWQCICLAIVCQIGTGPLSYHYFHTFPRYFMITNLLTVPLVAATMYVSAASFVIFSISGDSSTVLVVLRFLLGILNGIVSHIADI